MGGLPFFFYGTLMDADLLELVAGEAVPREAIEPASLRGFRRTGVAGRSYPMLVRRSGGRVEGILVRGLGRDARRRFVAYEGTGYRLARLGVTDLAGGRVTARIFLDAGAMRSDGKPWSLAGWRRRWKRRALRRAGRLGGGDPA